MLVTLDLAACADRRRRAGPRRTGGRVADRPDAQRLPAPARTEGSRRRLAGVVSRFRRPRARARQAHRRSSRPRAGGLHGVAAALPAVAHGTVRASGTGSATWRRGQAFPGGYHRSESVNLISRRHCRFLCAARLSPGSTEEHESDGRERNEGWHNQERGLQRRASASVPAVTRASTTANDGLRHRVTIHNELR
jgi:hypothetical protein